MEKHKIVIDRVMATDVSCKSINKTDVSGKFYKGKQKSLFWQYVLSIFLHT
jgi:hypothetical protein